MPGPGILTTALLTCKDPSSRKTVITAFQKIIAYTQSHEPNVLQYAVCLPLDDKSQTQIYMIEEYTDQAASDAHLTTQPVQDLIKLFSTSDVLAGPPEVHNCPVVCREVGAKGVLKVEEGPAIVLARTKYAEGSVKERFDGWKKLTGEAGTGSGWGAFIVTEDKEGGSVRTEYVLRDWAAYEEFKKSDVLKAHERGSKAEAEAVRIKPIAGYLGRESRSKL